MELVKCEECGADYGVGTWPFCGGDPSKHEPVGEMYHEGFEPYVDVQLLDRKDPRCTSVNHLGMRGVPIGSRSERRALMKEKDLQYGTGKFAPLPGSKLYFT